MNPDSDIDVDLPFCASCAQLQSWRLKGLSPQLHSAPNGWVLILDTTKWGQVEIHERGASEVIRYCTAPCESPEAAIEMALRMVRP
jgi:hypothetical protein